MMRSGWYQLFSTQLCKKNRKATLWHCKLTKSKLSIFHTSFCVYILMKTKPLDANTSSMHERGSWPPAHQGSMENTDEAAVPSDKDNSAPKDAMSSDPGTDEESQEGNSSQPSHKLLNLHFHSNLALLPYPQLWQKNIQLLLMTMKLRMKMEKLKGLLSMSHTVHQHLGDNWLSLMQNRSLGLNPGEWPTAAKKGKKSRVHHVNLQVFRKRDMCNNVSNQLDYSTGCSLLL